MPRIGQCPTTIDDFLYLSTATVKQSGCLIDGKTHQLGWNRNGERVATIDIAASLKAKCLMLRYSFRGETKLYRIDLLIAPSNLGKGTVFYFVCPITAKRCRKLYLVDGRFISRYALADTYYEKQLWSKRYRDLDNTMGRQLRGDDFELYQETFGPYAKRHYRGKPTKRVLRYQRLTDRLYS
ncbi:hypothetical protein [Spirosoma oryzicola]|uniref:hypothetical protein n=1 Tax=Spirosoma oryzicola TaxID=2898794 RepID=UPI001E3C1845|nr:hypothetical protein [Spirosoma oryzicola]UHG92548.1 hypothetical protein LQ777_06480 [Spirosoma oryzicola]